MPFVPTTDGSSLYFRDTGPFAAPNVILMLHGLPLSGRMFDGIADQLAQAGIRCLALDLRGFGQSAGCVGAYSFARWSQDVHDLLGALRLTSICLVGYSFGGAVAIHYLSNHGATHVGRLALLAATGPCLGRSESNPDGLPREALSAWAATAREDLRQLIHDVGVSLFAREPGEAVRAEILALGMEALPEAAARGLEELRDHDLRGSLRQIQVPTLICQGSQDLILPWSLGAGLQHSLLANSRLVAFEGDGHGFYVESRDRLARELQAFVTGH